MKIERLKVADLKPAERNTRTHNQKQIAELIRSFKMFGQIRPIVIDENNVIWCGNGFYQAAKEAGEAEVDCLRMIGLSEDQKKKLMLADNQIFTLGGTNTIVMDEILSELGDFDVPGYDAATLEQLYGVIDEETVQTIVETETQRNNEQEQRVIVKDEKPAEHTAEDDTLPPTIESVNGMVSVPKDKDTRPFIICPRCGEKIWV